MSKISSPLIRHKFRGPECGKHMDQKIGRIADARHRAGDAQMFDTEII